MANIYIYIYIDPLLGSGRETNNGTTHSARQQILDKKQLHYNRGTAFSTRAVPRCYKQDSWSSESVVGYLKPSRMLREESVRICYQETTGDFVCCSYSDIWSV
jgi:hypothetical protein